MFRQLRDRLAASQLPIPRSRAVNDARLLPFAYNAAPPAAQHDPEREQAQLARQVQALQAEVDRLRDKAATRPFPAPAQRRELQDAISQATRALDDAQAASSGPAAPASPASAPPGQPPRPRPRQERILDRVTRWRVLVPVLGVTAIAAAVIPAILTHGFHSPPADPGRTASPPATASGTASLPAEPGGTVRWAYRTGGYVGSGAVVVGNTVYIGSDDKKVYALDAATDHIRWAYKTGGIVDTPVVVAGGTVYADSSDETVYALNAANGHTRWTFASTGGTSSPAVAGNTVYFGSYNHKVYALATGT